MNFSNTKEKDLPEICNAEAAIRLFLSQSTISYVYLNLLLAATSMVAFGSSKVLFFVQSFRPHT